MEFYSMKLKKKIDIPAKDITEKVIKGRRFAVGKYTCEGKKYDAYRILGSAKPKKK